MGPSLEDLRVGNGISYGHDVYANGWCVWAPVCHGFLCVIYQFIASGYEGIMHMRVPFRG